MVGLLEALEEDEKNENIFNLLHMTVCSANGVPSSRHAARHSIRKYLIHAYGLFSVNFITSENFSIINDCHNRGKIKSPRKQRLVLRTTQQNNVSLPTHSSK